MIWVRFSSEAFVRSTVREIYYERKISLTARSNYISIIYECHGALKTLLQPDMETYGFHIFSFKVEQIPCIPIQHTPDSKVHEAYMGPTWVLSAPGRPHIGPMNLAITDSSLFVTFCYCKVHIVYTPNPHDYPTGTGDIVIFKQCQLNNTGGHSLMDYMNHIEIIMMLDILEYVLWVVIARESYFSRIFKF